MAWVRRTAPDGTPYETDEETGDMRDVQNRADVDATTPQTPMIDGKDAVSKLYGPGDTYTDARTTTRSFDPATGRTSLLDQRTGEVQTIGKGGLDGGPKLNLDPEGKTAMVPQNEQEQAVGLQKANEAKQQELQAVQRANPASVMPKADGSQPNSEQTIQELNKQGMKLKMSGTTKPKENIQKLESLAGEFEGGNDNLYQLRAQQQLKMQESEVWEARRQVKDLELDAQLAVKSQAIAKDYEDSVIAYKQQYDMRKKNAMSDYQNAVKSFSSMSVDPTKFWADRGTGGRIAGAVAVAMGAFSSSMTGAPNYALQIIDNAIERDIAAQRANIEQAGRVVDLQGQRYQMVREAYGDDMEQAAVLKASSYEAVKGQILAAKAQYGLGGNDPNSMINHLLNNIEVKIMENQITFEDLYNKSKLDESQLQLDIIKAKTEQQYYELQVGTENAKKQIVGEPNPYVIGATDPAATYLAVVPRPGPDGKSLPILKEDYTSAVETFNSIANLESAAENFFMTFVNKDSGKVSVAEREAVRMALTTAIVKNTGSVDAGLIAFGQKRGAGDFTSSDWIAHISDQEMLNLHRLIRNAINSTEGRMNKFMITSDQKKHWKARESVYVKELEVFARKPGARVNSELPGKTPGNPYAGGVRRYQ